MPGADIRSLVAAVSAIPAVPTILDVVCRTTGMGFAAVARVTDERWIACSVQDDIAFGLAPGGELPVETTICHEVRCHSQPVIIDNVAEDPHYSQHPTPALYGFQSYVSVPIVLADGSFFGTLCAIDPRPRNLSSPEIMGMFKLFGDLIAFHLDAQRQLETSQADLRRERETAELREQFIAVLGHDLRNPLAAIMAGLRLLERHPDKASEVRRQMLGAASRMAGLIDNILDFARGRLGDGLTLTWAEHSLEPMLQQVLEEVRATAPDRVINADLQCGGPILCDRARLAQLFANLIGNAIDHGAADQPVRVAVHVTGGALELSVANGGDAISAATMAKLFQPFFRGTSHAPQHGLGLGLYIASQIARAHGGRLTVQSDPAETRFTFRMPLQPQG